MKWIAGFVLCAVLAIVCFFPHRSGPTEVGVRTIKWSPFSPSGVEDRVYGPGGTYFFPALINDWQVYDTRLINIEMTFEENRGDRNIRDDLLFKTVDGNDISLDVIVSYRIDPKKAPYILQFVGQDDFEIKDKVVRTVARSRPRDIFGELKTEEFYISEKREAKSERAKQILNELLGPYGIIVERVSTKDYRFNAAYSQAIEDKKIAEQVAEQNKSASRAAEEEWLRRLEEAKGEVSKMTAEVNGRFRQAQLDADAYYGKQQRAAEAIEAEGIAEAKGIAEMNKALTGSGGDVMVKLKLAEALEGKRIVLLPMAGHGMDIKSTNINQLLQTYGLGAIGQGGSPVAAGR